MSLENELGNVSGVAVLDGPDLDSNMKARPDDPPIPVKVWIKDNLFSSVGNTILTVVFGIIAFFATRSFLAFLFSDARRWDAVKTNMRLLLIKSYPDESSWRVWLSVGLLLALVGIGLGLSGPGGLTPVSRVLSKIRSVGFAVLVVGLLAPFSTSGHIIWIVLGAVLVGVPFALMASRGDELRQTFTPVVPLVFGLIGVAISSFWWYPYGNYAFADGEVIAEPDAFVATSTKLPWTIMWLTLVAAWLLGRALSGSSVGAKIKTALPLLWLLAPFFVTWVIMRAPGMDWGRVATVDFPMFVGFALIGGAVLYWLTSEGLGEAGRLAAAGIVLFALLTWFFAFIGKTPIEFGWFQLWPMLQKARISFLLLGLMGLAAPMFQGERKKRLSFVWAWVGIMAILHFFATVMNTEMTLVIQEEQFFGGLSMTLFVATMTVIFSFPLGILLALARTSKMPLFRMMSTVFIEVIRGVPLITILFFFTIGLNIFLPPGMEVKSLATIVLGYSLFSAAYLAENVRGGLQSIGRGQFEAADALGLTGLQRTGFIVMPQALRVSIPPIVGQLIATFKETSLIYIIGSFDLLRVGANMISAQSDFLSIKKEPLLFISVIYWVVSYSMSRYSRSLEVKLGLGTR